MSGERWKDLLSPSQTHLEYSLIPKQIHNTRDYTYAEQTNITYDMVNHNWKEGKMPRKWCSNLLVKSQNTAELLAWRQLKSFNHELRSTGAWCISYDNWLD